MTNETSVSNIGTSTAWPLPVRSRANSAASSAETTPLELVLSATMVGRKRGWPATTALQRGEARARLDDVVVGRLGAHRAGRAVAVGRE